MAFFFLCMLCAGLLSGCGRKEENASQAYSPFSALTVLAADTEPEDRPTLADFGTASIGILTGSSYDPLVKERFPEAERVYYSTTTDMILSTEQGKIDGFICDSPYYVAALWEGANLDAVKEPVDQTPVAFAFSKSDADSRLVAQMNEFILTSKENGLLEDLEEKWLNEEEPPVEEHPDYENLSGGNGTITVAVDVESKPLVYLKDNRFTGYEIEFLVLFAEEYGYQLDLRNVSFNSILPGIHADKYDMGAAGFTITEERKESVTFSESYLTVDALMVIRGSREEASGGAAAAEDSEEAGFFAGLAENFEKTFIRESRWKMIVEGIGVTLLISICSVIGGSALGFGLYMLSRARNHIVRSAALGVARIYSRIIAGTPTVVVLMILYYVIFGSIEDISGVPVSIVGFSLTFGSFVYSHLSVCVGSVDKGQTEAAYALGYPRNKAFFRIILPQSMMLFLPSYCDQAVSLVLATAVVGYIAVNDLTRMGDIIRSTTYEAFFPLFATAAVYFLLTWLLSILLNRIKLYFDPRRRSQKQILKGVKTK